MRLRRHRLQHSDVAAHHGLHSADTVKPESFTRTRVRGSAPVPQTRSDVAPIPASGRFNFGGVAWRRIPTGPASRSALMLHTAS